MNPREVFLFPQKMSAGKQEPLRKDKLSDSRSVKTQNNQNEEMNKIPCSRIRKLRTMDLGKGKAELITKATHHEQMTLIDLASNDYLGLSRHPKLIEAAYSAMNEYGLGSGSSRFITGTRPIHQKLEAEIGTWLGRDQVFLFPSGFQANIAGVTALANRHTPVIADRLIHHSLLVGIKASGAKMQRFAHNNLHDLNRILERNRNQTPKETPLVISESLFSMEGTSPQIKEMAKICAKHGANLFIDEAHALGVLGPSGKGLCHGLPKEAIAMISGTFGKAFGGGGAFLATNKVFGNHLLQTSGAFRYTTALAPPLAAAALTALNLIKSNPDWGEKLQLSSQLWRSELSLRGWERPQGHGPILSLVIGADQDALDQQKRLEKAGLLCIAIRPPTVPEKTARLRVVLRKDLPKETLWKLLEVLDKR